MSKTLVTLAIACAAGALGLVAVNSQAAPAGPSPDEVIAARQASFDMSAATFGGMSHAAEAPDAEAKKFGFQANALAKWAKVLPTLFPAGTGPGGAAKTAALPTIWSDRAGFDKAAGDYAAATAKLLELSKANDTPGFKAQLGEVNKACAACHGAYRAK
jgi:cytochrome c556